MNSKVFFILFLIPTFLYTTKPQPPLALPTTALAGANAEIARLNEENAKLAKQNQTLTAVVRAQAGRLADLKTQLSTAQSKK